MLWFDEVDCSEECKLRYVQYSRLILLLVEYQVHHIIILSRADNKMLTDTGACLDDSIPIDCRDIVLLPKTSTQTQLASSRK